MKRGLLSREDAVEDMLVCGSTRSLQRVEELKSNIVPSGRGGKIAKTYNRRDSLVVTHPTTNLPACGLSTAERTGSPVLHTLWSYVLVSYFKGLISWLTVN